MRPESTHASEYTELGKPFRSFGYTSGHSDRVKGFSLVEMLFYIALLSLALLAVTETLILVTRSYGNLRSVQRIEQEAGVSLERMVREIRDAQSVNGASSVFDSHPGKLLLNTTNASGATRTVEFFLDNGKLSLKENGVVLGALTSAKTGVTNLIFRTITTARSQAVKIEMTLQSGNGSALRTEHFYATAVLRDSY